MSRSAAVSEKNPFKPLVKAAKDGFLSANDIEQLNEILCEKASAEERISRLRFAFRLKRWVDQKQGDWPLSQNLEKEIADIYRMQFASAPNPALKLRYARWARRWGDEDFDWNQLEKALLSRVKTETTVSAKLAIICEADLDVEMLGEDIKPTTKILSKLLWSRKSSACAGLEFTSWSFGLHSDEGPKPPSQDAALFAAFSDDTFLAAIADGTGDSHDGARAAEIALQALAECLAATGQLKESTELAASAVRADNLRRKEENSCTMVAVYVKKENATLVHLSDPFHWIQVDGLTPSYSRLDKSCRLNVGGEPFGYTLTSSGNRVDCFTALPPATIFAIQEVTGLRSFVLGCDGLLPVEDEGATSNACPVVMDFDNGKKHPCRIAMDCSLAARKAMDEKRRSPDNITCMAGYRRQ